MPTTPYAKLLVSLNAGPTQSGAITTAANLDTVQLTAESTAQWDLTTPPRWEIYLNFRMDRARGRMDHGKASPFPMAARLTSTFIWALVPAFVRASGKPDVGQVPHAMTSGRFLNGIRRPR